MKKTIILFGLILVFFMSFSLVVKAEEKGNVISLKIDSYPEKTVYSAFEKLDTKGLVISATFSDGSQRNIGHEEIKVIYNRDGCFRAGDGYVTLSFGEKSIKLPVTVNRVEYDLSSLELNSDSTIYNGKFQSYSELLPEIIGLDGIPLKMHAFGGSTNAGVYDIVIDFESDSKDYLLPESRVITLTIKPAQAVVVWENTSFTYDGKSKTPTAYFIDVNGKRLNISTSGAATNAGQGYTALAFCSDPNYIFSNTKTDFEIKKADYDISSVKWSSDSFVYDGSKKGVTVSGLPRGISVIGYSGNLATDAGVYTATANLSWDKANYNTPPDITHRWEIVPANYDMSSVRFDSKSFVYDGSVHYPEFKGTMPVGADGIALEYSFSTGACHVEDGVVSVIISFKTDSKNYNVPQNRYSSVCITPLGIDIEWGEISLIYNGEPQAPSAFSDKCILNVSGEATDVGKYVAKTSTENKDFYIKNDSVEYTIESAINTWLIEPSDSECYENREIVLIGKSKFGNITYSFYSDSEAKKPISSPIACGKYYAVLSVNPTENYSGLTSNVIAFEIVPVVPVSFYAKLSSTNIRAFDKLSFNDVQCYVINNDGSLVDVDFSQINVIYENADSFRKKDTHVTLKYDKFVFELPIEIDYADYDLSNVEWRYTEAIYDGREKSPLIYGLPKGITVLEYIGSAVIDAGSYKVYAKVSYDRENYNEPNLPCCDFVIKKQEIDIPHIKNIYNGEIITPISNSELYEIVSSKGYTDVGKYSVSVKLKDCENYVFKENNDVIANGIFEIIPAKISVKVSDVKRKLFEPLGDVDYVITSGIIFGSDSITVSAYREGNRVFVLSNNPNYTLNVDAGRLIRLPYPTFKAGIIILLIFSLLSLAFFLGRMIYINRDKIVTAYSVALCRWHNRKFAAPEPRKMSGIHEIPPDDIIVDNKVYDENETEEEICKQDIDVQVPYVDVEQANILITDSQAKTLIKKKSEIIYTSGNSHTICNVDTLNENFEAGEKVDINILKERGLIDDEVSYIKILSRGKIDKPLIVYANAFSLSAVKMIALTGGQAIKVSTRPIKKNKNT